MALGGRWGRSENDEEADASEETDDASSDDTSETQVIEPSEVRTESDPWSE